jgi:hypothetical protein
MTYNITKLNLTTGEKKVIRTGLTLAQVTSDVKACNRAAAMPTCGDEYRYSVSKEGE